MKQIPKKSAPFTPRPECKDRIITGIATRYDPPCLRHHGSLGPLIRGASWKGVDSVGELSPDQVSYPG